MSSGRRLLGTDLALSHGRKILDPGHAGLERIRPLGRRRYEIARKILLGVVVLRLSLILPCDK
jgi:hypothetical protein